MTSRRTRRYEEDEELSSQDETNSRRQRKPRTRDTVEGEDRSSSRRNRSRRYEDDDDEEEYTSSKKEKEKETSSSKARRPTYEDDVSDDQSSRRNRRTRRDEDEDDRRASQRNRNARVEHSDEGDEGPNRRSNRNSREENRSDSRKGRRRAHRDDDELDTRDNNSSRTRRTRHDDSFEDEEEDTRRSRRTRRQDYSDEEEPPRNQRNRRRIEQDEDEESPPRSNRRRRRSNDEIDDRNRRTNRNKNADSTRKSEEEEDDNNDDLMDRWKNRPKFEELERDDDIESEEDEKETLTKDDSGEEANPFNKYGTNKDTTHVEEDTIEDSKPDQKPLPKKKPNPFQKFGAKSREPSFDQIQEKKKMKESPFGKANLKGAGKVSSSSFDKSSKQNNINKSKQSSIDKDRNIPPSDETKKRRRDKNSSSAILDVINWKLTGEEKYEGSDIAPVAEAAKYESKLDKEDTKTPPETKKRNKMKKESEEDDTDKKINKPKRKLKDNPFDKYDRTKAEANEPDDDYSEEQPHSEEEVKDNRFKDSKTEVNKPGKMVEEPDDYSEEQSHSEEETEDNPFNKYDSIKTEEHLQLKTVEKPEDDYSEEQSHSEEETNDNPFNNYDSTKTEANLPLKTAKKPENDYSDEQSHSEEETEDNPFNKYDSTKTEANLPLKTAKKPENDYSDEQSHSEEETKENPFNKYGKKGYTASRDDSIHREQNSDEESDKNKRQESIQRTKINPFQKYGRSHDSSADETQVEDVRPKQNGHIEPEEAQHKGLTNGNHDESVTDSQLKDSLKFLNDLPDLGNISKSSTLSNLMDTYLNNDYLIGRSKPTSLEKPKLRNISGDFEKMEDLEKNLQNIRQKNKKQPPPPTRTKPSTATRSWEDPKEQQRQKNKEKSWPPKEPPKDIGAYVVESFGQTDPYSKKLIKDIQRSKREEIEKKEAEKRAEIVSESTKPVSTLRSTFTHQPKRPRPGVQKPESNINEERSWIKHEKKQVVFDKPPDEPDWMTLIRNRRWKSTVKARFPCKSTDKTDFERRSTTPKNWKKLAKDKNALRMLSEIVGIGAEGEELFMRLASQRQKIEDEDEELDKLTEQELMAYEVARETLGEDAAYSLQMDNPLPAARMRPILSSTSTMGKDESEGGSDEVMETLLADMSAGTSQAYPFTTSQLEAAYLTNQLLRLHPEEFRKLMSLERSRQATLRWQFSADPFDSVHEHQSLPLEIAMLASQEPRVQQAMRKILSRAQDNDSVFGGSIPSRGRQRVSRVRSDGGYSNSYYGGAESDLEGYESSRSVSSNSSIGGTSRGRPKKKKLKVPPPVKPRGRSVSPSMLRRQDSSSNFAKYSVPSGPTLTVPRLDSSNATKQLEDDREVHAHGFLTDDELKLSEEISQLQQLTSNIGRDIDEELKGIESSLEDRKKGFYEDQLSRNVVEKTNAKESIDVTEIASRRKDFIDLDHETSVSPNVRDELPKTRHKVRRINSSAQLDAIFRRRRQMSESDTEDNDADDKQTPAETSKEMANLVKDINDTFGKE